jgi:hypothetical protein
MNNEIEITPVPEAVADTRQVCEIRFDCMVKMHDVAVRKNLYDGMFREDKSSISPQWFRANHTITLEMVKYADPYELGMEIKKMFNQLEKTIEQYERRG